MGLAVAATGVLAVPTAAFARGGASAATPTNGELTGLSCVSSNACEAVGIYLRTANTPFGMAMGWNGTRWKLQTVPVPTGASTVDLSGVSCTAANSCEAVGKYVNSAGTAVTLAEYWDGISWAVQSTPNHSGVSESFLTSVDCSAANSCEAVGYYLKGSGVNQALAEVWNGTSWTIQSIPNPVGSDNVSLAGVSCLSSSSCEAVGTFDNAGLDATLAEGWNGSSWAVQSTPNPSGETESYLSGISCSASTNSCQAVGNSFGSGYTSSTLAEAWNGVAWTIQPTPNPAGSSRSFLSSVSCLSGSSCEAVDSSETSTGSYTTLAEVWNGASWATQPTPNVTTRFGNILEAVSCPTANACEAVGSSYNKAGTVIKTLAEGWNGSSWAIQPSPNVAA